MRERHDKTRTRDMTGMSYNMRGLIAKHGLLWPLHADAIDTIGKPRVVIYTLSPLYAQLAETGKIVI